MLCFLPPDICTNQFVSSLVSLLLWVLWDLEYIQIMNKDLKCSENRVLQVKWQQGTNKVYS